MEEVTDDALLEGETIDTLAVELADDRIPFVISSPSDEYE